jgi:hypothetical protein
MPFMLIERFKSGRASAAGERFQSTGCMLPEGVVYHASWVDSSGVHCFQIMEAPHLELLTNWVKRWDDLIDFETISVLSSSEFWSIGKEKRS